MTARILTVGDHFTLPLDTATRRLSLIATSGAGKSNVAVVIAEEMSKQRTPWYAVDPKGDWWGVQSSGDGKHGGLPVPIFGGTHGNIPLEPTAGRIIAETIAKQRLSCVIDVSQMSTQPRYGFLRDFAETLLMRNVEPLHGFLDECHRYIPQTPRDKGLQLACLGAWENLITGGRNKGLGTTQISQRAALVNKNTLDISEAIIAMRVLGKRDRDVVDSWLETRADPVLRQEILGSLSSLRNGEAWFYAPEWVPGPPRRVQFRRRETFDSAATPEVGKSVTAPSTLADIDLDALGDRIRETVERVQADDPKVLRQTIATLRRQLAEQPAADPRDLERVHELEVSLTAALDELHAYQALTTHIAESLSEVGADTAERIAALLTQYQAQRIAPRPAVTAPRRRSLATEVGMASVAERHALVRDTPAMDSTLSERDSKILGVLIEYPEGRTHHELAFLSGYSAKASTVGEALASLRKRGYVASGSPIRATDAGVAAAGGPRSRATGRALLEQWLNHPRLGTADRKVLLALVDAYPEALTKLTLCEVTGYSPTASTVGECLARLRKLGVVGKGEIRAAPAFMSSIAEVA